MDPTVPPFSDVAELTRRMPRFRIVRLLVRTAMSELYLAHDTELRDRPVAVKVPVEGADPVRFAREVSVGARLHHPNIVPVIAAGGPSASPWYLVMPYLEGVGGRGPDLQSRLDADGPFDLDRTIRIADQLAAALDHAHDQGIVHRDVKPRNVLLAAATEHVYLCDFGIAKVAGEQLTVPGAAPFGTPGYSAPDPIAGRRSDVYSLGAVVYTCLAAAPPFAESDTHAVRARQETTDPPLVHTRARGVPRAVDAVLARAMARDPAERYGTCAEFVTALRTAARPRPRRMATALVPVRHAAGLARRHRLVAAALGVVLLAAVGLIGWWALPPGVGAAADADDLHRVPPALRADCRVAAPADRFATADSALRCRSGGRTVRFGLYPSASTMDGAYRRAVRAAGVADGTGDCSVATDAEHRYPATGHGIGRVLCATRYGQTTLVWTDTAARTVGVATGSDDAALRSAWTRWVGLPGYPTPAERSLAALVGLSGCHRTSAGSLDDVPAVTAAVTCDPTGDGANSVSYYRFGSTAALSAAVRGRVAAAKAPSGVDCSDGRPPGFLGVGPLDLRSVPVGQLYCHVDAHGTPVLEWSLEPLHLLATATGSSATGLARWWRGYYGFAAPTSQLARAVDAHADPVFPTADERALLRHVPAASRVDCMRPPHDQITANVGDADVTAVVCGPTRGTSIVFYYQFDDAASMNAAYAANVDVSGPRCTSAPADFHGDAPYAEDGAEGRLGCAKHAGTYSLAWTNDHLEILTLSYGSTDRDVLLDWWRFDAGPR